MLRGSVTGIRRVLLTLDAMGGVWQYAIDTAEMLTAQGVTCRLLGFGPPPSADMMHGVAARVDLVWTDQPLDWMVTDEAELAGVASIVTEQMHQWQPDLLHLAAPSQAADLPPGPAVVAQSHSCLPTWWAAVHGGEMPAAWNWQYDRNQRGFARADGVIVPTGSHGRAITRVYGRMRNLSVVPNAARPVRQQLGEKQDYVFAAGRWWDEGKNGQTLDAAAARSPWPVMMAGPVTSPNNARVSLRHAVALGQLTSEGVERHMSRAAIFAAPSLYEPFGLAVLEAANCGAVLLLADIDTFRELWDGAAVFVDPRDVTGWASAIAALTTDPKRRAALGRQATLRAKTLSFDRQSLMLIPAYQAALGRAMAII